MRKKELRVLVGDITSIDLKIPSALVLQIAHSLRIIGGSGSGKNQYHLTLQLG
jgi:hypothetical protein